MGYQKIGQIGQVWYVLKYMIHQWLEWQDAKYWARDFHPAWVVLATSRKVSDSTRKAYKERILSAYRGYEDD